MAVDGIDIGEFAKKYIGLPYVWGGESLTTGADCSGFVQKVFENFGIKLPRVTYDQIGQGAPIGLKGLRPGDLVFFDTAAKAGPDHVGIYLGNGKMIHTPRPGKSVEIVDMTKGDYADQFMGGRRISGVHATGSKVTDFEESPKLTKEELASSYGWAYGFLNSNPELKKLFSEAVKGTWTAQKFQAELRDTEWWKSNSETRRQAQMIQKTDPATWNAQLSAAIVQVKQLAAEIGAAIPANKISGIAKNMLETGMDENGMRNALGQYVTFTKDGTLTGEAGMHEYTMKQFAYANGVQLSDEAIKKQAQLVVRKLATTEDFENQVRQQAISMYPAYQKQIEAGANVADIASPYMQMMSEELELPYQSLDVSDPTIKQAMNGLDSTGKPVGMTLTDFQQTLRNDPRWKETSGALNGVMAASTQVLKDMGLVATSD